MASIECPSASVNPPSSKRIKSKAITETLLRMLKEAEEEDEGESSDDSWDTEGEGCGEDDVKEDLSAHTSPSPTPDSLPGPCSDSILEWTRKTDKANAWVSHRPAVTPILFTETPGLNVPDPGEEPRQFLDLLLTDDILNMTVTETNRFAEALLKANEAPRARIMKWKTLKKEELLIFLGLLYHMGTIPLTRISDYWNTDKLFNFPCFRNCMSRDRFMAILNCLHFAKNPEPHEPQPTDRLFRIRPLIDAFHSRIDEVITPTQKLCVGEPMVLCRGRLVFRIYASGMNRKNKFKLYMLTEPCGLVLRFVVSSESSDTDVGDRGNSNNVVHKLMEGRFDTGRSLFIDNQCNDVHLVHQLLERKTYCTGTLQPNKKGNPTQVLSQKLRKGQVVDAFTSNGVCVLKWRDVSDVMMISSEYGSQIVNVRSRKGGITISVPEAVAEYNDAMSGNVHFEQIMSYYPIERKAMIWYRKLGIHVFHLIFVNSYYLYSKSHPAVSLHSFRLAVIRSLLFPANSRPLPQIIPPSPTRTLGLSRHFPEVFEFDNKGKRKRTIQKRCRVCFSKGIRKDTRIHCPACEGSPPLCMHPCFVQFHKDLRC